MMGGFYEALQAGASGFVLKDDPPEQLIAAVRTIANGDALLSPTVTRKVIAHFARRQRRPPPPATRPQRCPSCRSSMSILRSGSASGCVDRRVIAN